MRVRSAGRGHSLGRRLQHALNVREASTRVRLGRKVVPRAVSTRTRRQTGASVWHVRRVLCPISRALD